MRPLPLFLLLAAAALAGLGFALAAGSVGLSWEEVVDALGGHDAGLAGTVVRELRLPRALSAFAVGGLLALAGALLQSLLENPLADPYVLGVSGGAAFGALLVITLGLNGAWVGGGAFLAALCSILLVFALAHGRGAWTPARLLLTGVVVAGGWGALVNLLLAIAPETNLRGMMFWLMGDLGQAEQPFGALALLVTGVLLCLPLARSLNVLARGETAAAALGVAVPRLRLALYLGASLFTAAAVTVGGSIGFVGLVVPHILRLIAGHDHRLLLPASVLLGGTLLVLADTLARTVVAPQQLPVGVLTALLGVPLFLYLLHRRPR